MTTYVYMRVSSTSQKTDRQKEALKSFIEAEGTQFVEEKASAKSTKRPMLKGVLESLGKGDQLVVYSIDRLARSLLDLQVIVKDIVRRGASVEFVKERMTFSKDATSPTDMLMLQILAAFAEFERSIINERRAEGIAAAEAQGKPRGKAPIPVSVKAKVLGYDLQGRPRKAVASELGISRAALYRIHAEYKHLVDILSGVPAAVVAYQSGMTEEELSNMVSDNSELVDLVKTYL